MQIAFTRRIFAGAKADGAAHRDRDLGLSRRSARTTTTCRHSIWSCSTSRVPIPRPTARSPAAILRRRLRFAERLAAMGKPAWVRFTLVPGLTDDPANVEGIAKFVAPMKNVEWVEVQPFHQMGAFKWKAMKMDYKLADTPSAPPELTKRVIEQFRAAGCVRR